jgi:hypothetical protein
MIEISIFQLFVFLTICFFNYLFESITTRSFLINNLLCFFHIAEAQKVT